MQKFILDCEAISLIETDLNNLKDKVIDVESSINAYELEYNNDFNFLEAKKAIITNINNIENKIHNTINLLEKVITTHIDIQNTIRIEYDEKFTITPIDILNNTEIEDIEELSFDFKNKKQSVKF